MVPCLFASDLHGDLARWEKLFRALADDPPRACFLGGDLFPSGALRFSSGSAPAADFIGTFVAPRLAALRDRMAAGFPRIFLVMGNDDGRWQEESVQELAERGLWSHIHQRHAPLEGFDVYGYACVPPTPFQLKDWERYDVSRHVDPGCVSPEEGRRTVAVDPAETRHGTIAEDLAQLVGGADLSRAVVLFHAPPHETNLDRAALDGRHVDHVPLDVHVGSVAVRRFVESCQPLVTLHGHVHESTRLTGSWRDRIGRTELFSAAHDGPELALVRFDLESPAGAVRELL